MATPHNGAEKGQIAKSVLMPGDPLRAKFVAEHFLEDAKLVKYGPQRICLHRNL